MNSGDIFEHGGRKFIIQIEDDDDAHPPWERDDGHGPVRLGHGTKRPGERVLYDALLYDFQAAVRLAIAQGWGYDGKGVDEWRATGLTTRQIAASAVERDFSRLQDWCNERWWYVGVVVTLCDLDGTTPRPYYSESLWGIESDAGDYLVIVAGELADSILFDLIKNKREE